MAESSNSRIVLPAGKQRLFIQQAKSGLDTSWQELAAKLGVNARTLYDWKREKFTMPFAQILILSKKAKIALPKKLIVKERYWYVSKGASIGGRATLKKYGIIGGDPVMRKKKWRQWWDQKGRTLPHPILYRPIPIIRPKRSEALAEFVGIVLGDGGISQKQVTITLHHVDDKEYAAFVSKLIKKLFGISPSVYHDAKDSVNYLVASRTELVKFCVQVLGLKIGNKIKQQVDMPNWIKESKRYSTACVRGLVDTDGSVFVHRYKVNGKLYQYKKLSFTSLSKPLLQSVCTALRGNSLRPRIARGKDVWLDSARELKNYFHKVGSHNPKHLKRYRF